MRELFYIAAMLTCVLFSGCGDDSTIGIIGGADGSTSVIISEKGEKTMYQQISAE